MKSPKMLFLVLPLFTIAACTSAQRSASDQSALQTKEARIAEPEDKAANSAKSGFADSEQVSLNQVDQSQSMAEAMNRKIIRNADLTLEVGAPAEVQRKITSIAESVGGFVVTSESKLRQVGDSKQELEVNLVIRVPATQFGSALDQIRNTGSRVLLEKMTGQDVTEEFIDLEARIKTQKALELQFLEIMKQAHKVEDALEVQRQIAEVRTEIEKLEGRKRFLENRASLSTITVNLQSPNAIVVNTSGFGRNIREAIADSVELAIAIVLFLIRLVIVMIPISILIILPGWLIARFLFRRARKMRFSSGAANKEAVSDSPPPPKMPDAL
jgi:uncharacterized protein DUF4349